MRCSIPAGFVTLLSVLLLVFGTGCTTPASSQVLIAGTIAFPANVGHVEVDTVAFTGQPYITLPEDPASAARGTAKDMIKGVAADPRGVILLPPFLLVGAAVSAAWGTPEKESARGSAAITAVLNNGKMEERVAEGIVKHLAAATAGPLTLRVGVHVTHVALEREMNAPGEINPSLVLAYAVALTASTPIDGRSVGEISLHYKSAPRKFAAWAANGAEAIRTEIGLAADEMVEAASTNIRSAAAWVSAGSQTPPLVVTMP